ncbi:PhzF family phenazine biosynthesis isomerase [Actinomadura graeca]|uniref:PhzF family phenazine biosynthesis isomerase n=1 Tax=Actinomadura graeca TaxID=2750812 RepID=A0ABX8QYJ0_9ACTN|nr:PhzF family phenazine biosynthesis isomerase [Actinomadura graeca]QXJ23807.1 PhzF family phenazine biosynthesis isomerase [Actinomadura graeca]
MDVLRYAAFGVDASGGNPAGVVLGARGCDDAEMQRIAAEVGFSETAFAIARADGGIEVRYFSPLAEVPFCGHATIALAVAYAHRHGPGELRLHTKAGEVPVRTTRDRQDVYTATLTSVRPRTVRIAPDDLFELLAALRWATADLDRDLPVRAAYAGAWHPVLAVRERARLADLDYDMARLNRLMLRQNWATANLLWRESPKVFHSRNPFPPGGVREDPATGAAAAALGGYLRESSLVRPPVTITVRQGEDMGRPSIIHVTVPEGSSTGIEVSGTAVAM